MKRYKETVILWKLRHFQFQISSSIKFSLFVKKIILQSLDLLDLFGSKLAYK